jgi:protein gp37
MSDLFQDGVPENFLHDVWESMRAAPQHQFQILTKRPDRMANFTSRKDVPILPNVWLGTSIENAEVSKDRLRELRRAKAAVKFVSFEPLLGPVGKMNLASFDWAIVGGESGPKSRPIDIEWVDQIHAQCQLYSVAFFFKQWGGKNKKATGRVYRGRTWSEFPAHHAV